MQRYSSPPYCMRLYLIWFLKRKKGIARAVSLYALPYSSSVGQRGTVHFS